MTLSAKIQYMFANCAGSFAYVCVGLVHVFHFPSFFLPLCLQDISLHTNTPTATQSANSTPVFLLNFTIENTNLDHL